MFIVIQMENPLNTWMIDDNRGVASFQESLIRMEHMEQHRNLSIANIAKRPRGQLSSNMGRVSCQSWLGRPVSWDQVRISRYTGYTSISHSTASSAQSLMVIVIVMNLLNSRHTQMVYLIVTVDHNTP